MTARHMRKRARVLIGMIQEQEAIARKHEGPLKRLRGETMARMQELLSLLNRCYCELGQGSEESEEGRVTQAQEGASEDTEPPEVEHEEGAEPLGSWDEPEEREDEIREQLRWMTEEARAQKKKGGPRGGRRSHGHEAGPGSSLT